MSSIDEISQMIEHLYTMERIITAIQKRPIDYGGVSLHANEAHTLKMIALNEGISQTELSEQMYRTKGATSVMVDKLVEKGLVHRQRVDGDQRRYLLTLTDRGRLVHASHIDRDAAHARWASEHLGLEEAELKTANEALSQIIAFYSQSYLSHGALATQPEY
ncbi:MarR family transcriptional regulator [Pseudoflavonifractor sp. BIOML-A6]|nr:MULTISPECIES: MarR family transcriptional regulator [unclassified Pseudoflavonifractor]MTQ96072.1 MarR family transcriptional regulator [Pseudoflavonifractor sp. BIOML-A16]MTR06212.1 MarR family transcriptional regulator [Pseudoflavonifractor sp. BIOML-A15]MTR33507.1 MarR family transcriptional regulator [Pseudoflavonifractor sp. BIOML-A14]MTR73372.1 MarR family transcriptional regulator [Pseudoflavonifractor sp. BIOML-A18]MTS63952.1 MarR family transcriptional regulator [Pseudoflavonifract